MYKGFFTVPMSNEEIYKQHILNLYTNPHNKEEMLDPDIRMPAKNVSCGDSFILYLKIHEGVITDATFSGVGCAISQAAASLLTDALKNKTVEEARMITEDTVYKLLGIPISIGREKCALLLFTGLKEALQKVC